MKQCGWVVVAKSLALVCMSEGQSPIVVHRLFIAVDSLVAVHVSRGV